MTVHVYGPMNYSIVNLFINFYYISYFDDLSIIYSLKNYRFLVELFYLKQSKKENYTGYTIMRYGKYEIQDGIVIVKDSIVFVIHLFRRALMMSRRTTSLSAYV